MCCHVWAAEHRLGRAAVGRQRDACTQLHACSDRLQHPWVSFGQGSHVCCLGAREAPQGVWASRGRRLKPYPNPCMLLLQVHTLMQQSQAMTAQQLQAFAAQAQAVQAQGHPPAAAAPQKAAAGGAQQPGAALAPQLAQMSGVAANPRSPSPAPLPAAQPAAVMPAPPGVPRGSGEQLAAPDSSAPGRLPAMQVGQAD